MVSVVSMNDEGLNLLALCIFALFFIVAAIFGSTIREAICKFLRNIHPRIMFIVFAVAVLCESLTPVVEEALEQLHFFFSPSEKSNNSTSEEPNNNKQKDFLKVFFKVYKNRANTCLGFFFTDDTPIEFYLAFSNEENDEIGLAFEKLISEKTRHIYCQFNLSDLYQKLRIKTWDADLNQIEISDPDYNKLTNRQKTCQTCAERKVIAKVCEEHHQFTDKNRLVIFTKYAPCEYCLSLIHELNNDANLGLVIHVICVDFLKWLKDNEKKLENVDNILTHANQILSAIDTSTHPTNSNNQKEALRKIATEQAKSMLEDNIPADPIKKVLSILSRHNSNAHLTNEEIESLASGRLQGGSQL